MRHFFRLMQRFSLLTCASLPMMRLRLTTENPTPKDQFQTIQNHILNQQIDFKLNLASLQEDKSQESQTSSQKQQIQAQSKEFGTSKDQPQQQKNNQNQINEQNAKPQEVKKQQQTLSSLQQKITVTQQLQTVQQAQRDQSVNINENISLQDLPPNSVLVSGRCPQNILKYLEKVGLNTVKISKSAHQVAIKNKNLDVLQLNLAEIKQSNKDQLKIISNFINPPQQISTIQQAKSYLSVLQRDSFTIMAYIPHQEAYRQFIERSTASSFDTFTKARTVDIQLSEKQYKKFAYNSSSNKDNYIIVRTPETAQFLKLDTFKIGEPFLLHQTSKESGNQSNYKIQGKKYLFRSLVKNWSLSFDSDTQALNKQTHFYINKVQTQSQLYNKVRQMQMSGDKRKILLFCTQQTRQDFRNNNQKILEEVSRLQKDKVLVITTSNEQAIKNIFRVQPDSFATIRLIDINSTQEPLFWQQNEKEKTKDLVFKRQRLRGPFKVQNICKFVASQPWTQYYQSKKNLTQIETISPKELQTADKTLVLLQKSGCNGCKYVQQSLSQLNSIIKTLKQNKKTKRNTIYKYRIEQPESLASVDIKRYSIFNQNFKFTPPRETPKLYYYKNGKYFDLKVDESLANLNNVAEIGEEAAHIAVLRDIINKIRLKSNDL